MRSIDPRPIVGVADDSGPKDSAPLLARVRTAVSTMRTLVVTRRAAPGIGALGQISTLGISVLPAGL
jgi:hypothetical protein